MNIWRALEIEMLCRNSSREIINKIYARKIEPRAVKDTQAVDDTEKWSYGEHRVWGSARNRGSRVEPVVRRVRKS